MKTVFPNIVDELERRNMSYRQLAQEMGLSNLAMYRRLVGITKWTLQEAIYVGKYFSCNDLTVLFQEKERS